MRGLLAAVLVLGMLAPAQGQEAIQPEENESDPFGQSQFDDPTVSGSLGGSGTGISWSGFIDSGFIYITQTGPEDSGGDLSWAYGNSQFTFFSQTASFTLNEVDLTLDAERETDSGRVGARFSIDFYPSRDTEAYGISGSEREFDVDQAYVFVEFKNWGNTRLVLGRAPGFVTLEQQEADSPELRLIGHTYVYLAGGGYPYGFQVLAKPFQSLAVKVGIANGGMGDYSFFPGDDSTLNRPVARDADDNSASDKAQDLTYYGAVEWVPLDKAAEGGTFKLGVAAASNPGLTYNATDSVLEPYSFTNLYASYRYGIVEVRSELAVLKAYYELSLGKIEARMGYLLLSLHLGADHLITGRAERMTFTSDQYWGNATQASKYGLSYRYRMDGPAVIKLEAQREVQSPQFYVPGLWENLTTDVASLSWVYSY